MVDKIAIIGAGMMGGAITKSLLKNGYKGSITVTDCASERLNEMQACGAFIGKENRKTAADADIIFVCVKPGDVENLLKEISKETKGKIIISIAATLPLDFLKKTIKDAKFVRVMPNIAILVQEAYTAFCCTENVSATEKAKVVTLLNMMGKSEEVDEKYMDAITGLSGSGPGYLSVIAEAMIYGGLKVGLPRNIALNASAQTMLGTAKLILDLQENPAKIKDMVTTPGGTTIDAIYALEKGQVRQALIQAIEDATLKSQKIREKICKENP
ncbi:MAG: pyrroline-5-carboxylate reductase [Crenarchaeota archaeon]|nr:pyrroline-5-carboxylate reductase [Thermoproteota archaeon]